MFRDLRWSVAFFLTDHRPVREMSEFNARFFFTKDLLAKCATPLGPGLAEDKEIVVLHHTSFNRVLHKLVREVTSPNLLVREQVGSIDVFSALII